MRIKWAVPLFVVSFCVGLGVMSGVLYAQPQRSAMPVIGWDQVEASLRADRDSYQAVGWGPNIRLTCTLMKNHVDLATGVWESLAVDRLFGMYAKDVIRIMSLNANEINADDLGFDSTVVNVVKAVLGNLNEQFQSNSALQGLRYKDLYTTPNWSATVPTVTQNLDILAKCVQVPFWNHSVPSSNLDDAITRLTANFKGYDLADLMFTPAGPEIDEAHRAAAEYALYDAKVLLKVVPDVVLENKSNGKLSICLDSKGFCCNKTTRVCQTNLSLTCMMCGAYCCLGSQWCPQ